MGTTTAAAQSEADRISRDSREDVTANEALGPLSFDEKYQLSIDICKLPVAELNEIVSIIRECAPSYRGLKSDSPGNAHNADEIDVNQLDDATLRRIQQYIRTTLVDYGGLRIVIMDSPKANNLASYIEQVFKKYNVTDVVRVCDARYSLGQVEAHGIRVHEWKFKDGEIPSKEIVNNWIDLVADRFDASLRKAKEGDGKSSAPESPSTRRPSIAVHCAAGLGRAPVLACVALIELTGMDNAAAVEYMRNMRPGAINKAQLEWLLDYKKRGKSTFLTRTLRKIFR